MFKRLNDFEVKKEQKESKDKTHAKYIPVADEEMLNEDKYEEYMTSEDEI